MLQIEKEIFSSLQVEIHFEWKLTIIRVIWVETSFKLFTLFVSFSDFFFHFCANKNGNRQFSAVYPRAAENERHEIRVFETMKKKRRNESEDRQCHRSDIIKKVRDPIKKRFHERLNIHFPFINRVMSSSPTKWI